MIKKLKLYLDTSILNFLIAEDVPKEKNITQRLFEEIDAGKYEAYISSIVIAEVEEADEPLRERLSEVIRKHNLNILSVSWEAEELSEQYLKAGVIPRRYADDTRHIASAVLHNLDVVVSWNFSHIVKVKTRLEINGINKLLGYKEIEIASPEEVIEV
ncbi:MAG: PIN domain-containing protein [bacterium]|nr:PIN domain-containing protein [bacterium]